MKKLIIIQLIITGFTFWSCNNQSTEENDQVPVVSVKATTVQGGSISDYIELNGKTVFLKKNTVYSPISGYVYGIHVKFGDNVTKNEVLFELQTKENKALESTEDYKNTGIINVYAGSKGYVNELNINESGTYVTEGSVLCSIAENKDLMIELNVPFEYISLLKIGTKCSVIPGNGSELSGTVLKILPTVNELDQTQTVLIKLQSGNNLPENLNVLIRILKSKHENSLFVPKNALMTNETQTEFWLMKIIQHNTAVKVPVTKGIQNDSIVEILSGNIMKNDTIITEGAYGLQDSAFVKIKGYEGKNI